MKKSHLIIIIVVILTCVSYWSDIIAKKSATAIVSKKDQKEVSYFRVQNTLLISLKRGDHLNPTEEFEIEIGDENGLISPVKIQHQLSRNFPYIPEDSYFIIKRNEDDSPQIINISENAAYTIMGGDFTPSYYELILVFVDIASKKPKNIRFNYP